MDRVSFTQDEAQWFKRNVLKMKELLESSSRKDKGILERSTYKSISSMAKKAEPIKADAESVDFILPRKQRLVLRDLIMSVHKNLVTRVIPTYEQRLGKVDSVNYREYLEMAKDKAVRLEKMARKLK